MIYRFDELMQDATYTNNCVIFACGSHPLFTSIAVDRAKELCKADFEMEDIETSENEFGTVYEQKAEKITSLSFDNFLEYVRTPSIFGGRWTASALYSTLNKAQKDAMWAYARKPNRNGLLVIIVDNYKDIRDVRGSSVARNSKEVACLNIEYPSREGLQRIVNELFEEHGLKVDERANKFFISRMSIYYDEYSEVISEISCSYPAGTEFDLYKMRDAMKGKENYIFDDFLQELVKPCSGNKRCKVYKMANSLIEAYGSAGLRRRLLKNIDTLLRYRVAINEGKISVLARINVAESKRQLGDRHPLCKDNDINFRKRAYLASKTSLKDWLFMKLLLLNVHTEYDEVQCERAILAMINRWSLCNDRLMNALGVKDTLREGLVELNQLQYRDLMDTSRYDKALAELLKREKDIADKVKKADASKEKREQKKLQKEYAQQREEDRKRKLAEIYMNGGQADE